MASIMDFVGDLAGYYRDIEVAKAAPAGGMNGRAETIADQSTVGRVDLAGPATPPQVNPANFQLPGIQVNKTILYTTAAVVATIALVQVLR